ncbi:hypothetical protein [Herbaspirillum sp. CAH-3]|uniref:hypothetical protein n=1 Tax=Herbaspirillum sp. CAH-3 TaxID=2605746 RepID=UPI0012AC6E36|nr:hypothetical protein [Herbaspirillum sp. CAH-3]MRT31382.1 hypothetical protein [Herbaspirillum sp. CAH-3]
MELMVDGDSIILSHVHSGMKSSRAVDSPMPDHSFQRLQKLSLFISLFVCCIVAFSWKNATFLQNADRAHCPDVLFWCGFSVSALSVSRITRSLHSETLRVEPFNLTVLES